MPGNVWQAFCCQHMPQKKHNYKHTLPTAMSKDKNRAPHQDTSFDDLDKGMEVADDIQQAADQTTEEEQEEMIENQETEIDKLTKDLADATAALEKEKKEYLFLMAEFDNFRKRTDREKSAMFEIGAKDIIERILPVLDNFERGLGAVSEEEREGAFVQGIEKIYKQLVTALEEAGVKPIEAVGKEFDPNFHNAVMHAEDEELGENLVAEEFQKGYLYKESVVRHSMVKVVN